MSAGRFVPGLGHHLHKQGDPRTPVIISIAHDTDQYGPHLALFEAVGRVAPSELGKTLPLNGAGVCGAALADLGIPLAMLRGVVLLARCAGLLGHLAEEMRRPIAGRSSPTSSHTRATSNRPDPAAAVPNVSRPTSCSAA